MTHVCRYVLQINFLFYQNSYTNLLLYLISATVKFGLLIIILNQHLAHIRKHILVYIRILLLPYLK